MSPTQRVVRLDDALHFNATNHTSRLALFCTRDLFCDRLEWCDHPDGLSWKRLDRLVTQTAWLLKDTAGWMNRRIVHEVTNRVSDVVIALACARAGLVEVPIDSAAGENYVRQCRAQVGGVWLNQVQKQETIERANRLQEFHCQWPTPSPDDPALVLWTSGTTESPKGVVLSHRALCCNAYAKLSAARQTSSDRRLTVLSIGHAYARTCDLGTWLLAGSTLAIARGYDGWRDMAERFQPTVVNVVPSLSERILDDTTGCESLQMLGCGGAAMDGEQFRRWTDRGVSVIQGYGLTESGPVISSQTREDSIPGHAGKIVQSWQHRIDSHDRLFVRGPCLMSGYLDDAIATEQRIDPEGWLNTGDVVRKCPRTEQLQILGRADDRLTLTSGYTIDPLMIEKRVAAIPAIRSCLLMLDESGRKLRLWIETTAIAEESLQQITDRVSGAIAPLANWERPSEIRYFRLSQSEREQFFSPKGTVRRIPLANHLRQTPILRSENDDFPPGF
ncbi:class I adenylate-forming enzyme family protein [Roseiconus lacunae]|uniref:class I adenylate-forming enzyme family protein n=1 Tax=Roseiconus lacunae TaxID=2605694 RepID=UPI0011F2DB0B|nr:AMP-binding protein [Roseiconus lacunae]WRQ50374.1 AMP-binding protein [Stieleria sp. HD01]